VPRRHLRRYRGDCRHHAHAGDWFQSDSSHARSDRRSADENQFPSQGQSVLRGMGQAADSSQRWVAELVDAAGGDFVGTPGMPVDPAAVCELQPDVLIAAWCGAGDRVPLEKIVRQRGWQNLAAVQNGCLYCISDEYLNTPAPTLI